jgi:hypothetical protein
MEWIRIIPSRSVGITFPPLKDFYPIHSYPQPVREGPRVATVGPLVPTPQSTFQTKLPYKPQAQTKLRSTSPPFILFLRSPHFPIPFLPDFNGFPVPPSGLPNRSVIASMAVYVL